MSGAFGIPPSLQGKELAFHGRFLLGSTHICVSGALVVACLCFPSRRRDGSVAF